MSSAENSPYIVEDRRMISRVSANRIKITHTIEPGKRTKGILTCCHAPISCPLFSWIFPCCDYPQYIVNEMNASQYIYVRENSVEWNNPSMRPNKGYCCGSSCSDLTVKDNITVVYFDDVYFDEVKNGTRCCHASRTECCGGKGERVQIRSTFFCGLLQRRRNGICAVPTCCNSCFSCCCCDEHEMWVENANAAANVIKNAQDDAKRRLKL